MVGASGASAPWMTSAAALNGFAAGGGTGLPWRMRFAAYPVDGQPWPDRMIPYFFFAMPSTAATRATCAYCSLSAAV